ncbi:MAG: LamG domain-containing protein [Chitinispirillaceae bacterium]
MFFKILKMISVLSLIIFAGCAENKNAILSANMENSETGMAIFKTTSSQNSPFTKIADSAIIVISAEDMLTIVEELIVTDSSVEGTLNRIPAGPGRTFQIKVFDSTETLQYSGKSTVEVIPDTTVEVFITIRRVTGNTVIGGNIVENPIPTDGLLAYYSLNGTVQDKSGNELHGNIEEATYSFDRFLQDSSAVRFNGIDQYITVVDSPTNNFDFGQSDFSISTWIKTHSSTIGDDLVKHDVISKGDSYNTGFSLVIFQNKICACLGDIGYDGLSTDTTEINDNDWHHTAVVRESGTVKIYVDGKISYSYFFDGDVTTDRDLIIGKHGTKMQNYFEGDLDEIGIYNRSLTEEEIISLAENR